MRALVYQGPGEIVLTEVGDPAPGPGEVLLEVAAAGICGTDRHIVAGELGVAAGTIPGHEVAGRVASAGAGVDPALVGRRFACYGQAVCGECPACLSGRQNRCRSPEGLGIARPGGFAEALAVPVSCLVPLPDDVPDAVGAIVADAVATPFHALTAVGGIRVGETVVVVGAGGVGLNAVLLARLAGAARVVVADPSPAARDAAAEAGADAVFDPAGGDDPGRALRSLARGATLAIECVGRDDSVEMGLAALAPGGRLVVVGVGDARPSLPPLTRFIGMELAVLGSYGSTLAEVATVVNLVASGRLDVSRSLSHNVSLAEAPAVFAAPPPAGRIVIAPQGGA